jgi:serine/threonine-protein kinase
MPTTRRVLLENDWPVPAPEAAQDLYRKIRIINGWQPVLEHLGKIAASRTFSGSESLKRLIQYLVLKVLHSQEGDIKEYSLGMEVFNRGSNFDPRTDTIVRVQARRLRLKLRQYYGTEGRHDLLRIEVPTGSYVPVISHHEPLDLPCRGGESTLEPVKCRIAVLPFLNLTDEKADNALADALTETLIDDLTVSAKLGVTSRTSAFIAAKQYKSIRSIGRYLKVDAILEGSVQRSGKVIRVKARLINANTGFTFWATAFDIKSRNLLLVQQKSSALLVPQIKSLLCSGGGQRANLAVIRTH